MPNPPGEVHRIADAILSRIIAGTYPSGLRLPSEVALATEFSCGRSTVREALRHLAGLGVVRSRRGSGAMVLDFRREGTPALLTPYVRAGRFDGSPLTLARELLRIRSLLAVEAVRLAALYAPAGALAAPRAILASAREVEGDPAAHSHRELELFRALVIASAIWPAVWFVNAFWTPMRELQSTLAPAVGRPPPDFQAAMGRLLNLIEARDADAAERHLSGWLARVDAVILASMASALGGGAEPVKLGAGEVDGGTTPAAERAAPVDRRARAPARTTKKKKGVES
jgi:GntR family transcriptional regulator, transcriptional repressor for pyruvate dehydrogenase complex